jgi:hypothetical protein
VTFMDIVIQSKISEVLSQCMKAGSFQKFRARVSTKDMRVTQTNFVTY